MGLLDRLHRVTGMPTKVEIAEAQRKRAEMAASEAPCDQFATMIAATLQNLSTRDARNQSSAVRESKVEWSRHPDMRWVAAASLGRRQAIEHLDRRVPGMDPALSRAINERALEEVAKDMSGMRHNAHATKTVGDVLQERTDGIAYQVRATLSTGRIAELNARAQSTALQYVPNPGIEDRLERDVAGFVATSRSDDREKWLMDAMRTRTAMAQTGVLSAERTVDMAMDAKQITHMRIGATARFDRDAAQAADVREQIGMVAAARRQTFIQTYGTATPEKEVRTRDASLFEGVSETTRAGPRTDAAMAGRIMDASMSRG